MSDIDVRPDFLPDIVEKEVCVMFAKQRSFTANPFSDVTSHVTDHHRCGVAYLSIFNGLFSKIGFNQDMIENNTYHGETDIKIMDDVFNKIASLRGPVRLAIKKFVDEDGNYRYAKYIDFDITKVVEMGGLGELKKIIYMMIRACDLEGELVPNVDESWIKEDTCHQTQEPQKRPELN